MEWWLALVWIVGGSLVLMATGLPIAFCFFLINLVGVYIFWGGELGLSQLIHSLYSSLATFVFVPIPLFILMGELLFHSGIASNLIYTLDKWMGRLPGRLGLVAVGMGTLLSVMTGEPAASLAILGKGLVPEMERYGYKKPMSLGPVLGSCGLAPMIPPSSIAILIAGLGAMSVSGVLMGGIIPGLIMAVLYATYIIGRCWLQPSIAPSYKVTPTPLLEKIRLGVYYVLPIGLVIFAVLGVIILGIASPSEAGATGVLGVVILVALQRKLNWQVIKKATASTARVTAMIFLIIASATAFSQVLAFSGATKNLIELVISLPLAPVHLVMVMMFVMLIMGMFIPFTAMIMICIPLFMPIIEFTGLSPVWFGVLVLLNVEMATTSPPFGGSLFVMKGVAPPDTTMGDIYRAALPFLGCDLIVLIGMILFPPLVLWLPSLMR